MRSFLEPIYKLMKQPSKESFKVFLYEKSQKLGSFGTEEKILCFQLQLLR